MDDHEAEARRALAAIPGFARDTALSARLTRLQGLTNRVYKVEAAGQRFCLRIPGPGTAALIDRRAEAANARAAAATGIAPEILHFAADGVMLTRFIDDAVTLSPQRFRDVPGAVERAAWALRHLHDEAKHFTRAFEAFAVIPSYVDLLSRRGVQLPSNARSLLGLAAEIRQALAAHPVAAKPCHCDPTGGNLLDTGARIWIVDWEYSAMNDPMWDLAYFALEGGFDGERNRALLAAYLGRAPAPPEAGRMALYKPVADLLSGLWALIQHTENNPAADFLADAQARFARGAYFAGSPGFARQLETVRHA
jgi:thiamine kinase-like enzyme